MEETLMCGVHGEEAFTYIKGGRGIHSEISLEHIDFSLKTNLHTPVVQLSCSAA